MTDQWSKEHSDMVHFPTIKSVQHPETDAKGAVNVWFKKVKK